MKKSNFIAIFVVFVIGCTGTATYDSNTSLVDQSHSSAPPGKEWEQIKHERCKGTGYLVERCRQCEGVGEAAQEPFYFDTLGAIIPTKCRRCKGRKKEPDLQCNESGLEWILVDE